MKRFIATMLLTPLLLSLCSCSSNKIEESQQSTIMVSYEEESSSDDYLGETEDYQGETEEYETEVSTSENSYSGPEPTDKEYALLYQYKEIVEWLIRDSGNGGVSEVDESRNEIVSYDGQEAMDFCYRKLQELTAVDGWEEWCAEEWGSYNWNRQDILDGFSVTEDVLLEQVIVDTSREGYTTTHGNDQPSWSYDTEGRLSVVTNPSNIYEQIESSHMNISYDGYYIYDDNDILVEVRYDSIDSPNHIVTPTYDANGKIISEHVISCNGSTSNITAEQDINYTYNGDLLVKVEWTDFSNLNTVAIDYTYDANSNVVKAEKTYYYNDSTFPTPLVSSQNIMEYTYDENGHLVSGMENILTWFNMNTGSKIIHEISTEQQNQYVYSCDESGRPLTLDISYGDEINAYGSDAGKVYRQAANASRHVDYIYGNYYYYPGIE